MRISRVLGILALGLGVILTAPLAVAAPTQLAQGAPQGPQAIPPDVIQTIADAACDPDKLKAAITAAVSKNPTLAPDIAALATGQCPSLAADIAATAAAADPNDAAAIVVAVLLALPPGQAELAIPGIVAAVEAAVPGSSDLITTAIGVLALNGTPQGRSDIGAPLIAPIVKQPPASPI